MNQIDPSYTINVIWVIIASATLLLGIFGSAIALHRNIDKNTSKITQVEQFASGQIGYLKAKTESLHIEDDKIKELIERKHDKTLSELKNVESQLQQHLEISMYIKTTLEHILKGTINLNKKDNDKNN